MNAHIDILEKLSKNDFPDIITEQSFPSITIFKELYESRFIEANDNSSLDGDAYSQPRITTSGRNYLASLKSSSNTINPTINNTIHVTGSFNGILQSGTNNSAIESPVENANGKSALSWVMDNIIGVVVSGLILAAVLTFFGIKGT